MSIARRLAVLAAAGGAAEAHGAPGNYVLGANIAGFTKVADTMLDLGVI